MATFDTNTTPAIPIQSVSDVAADLAAIIVKEETNHLTLDPAPTDVPTTEGTLSWNDQDRTLNIQTEVSTVTQQVGQEQFVRCRNSTGSTISNGKVVYLSGSSGQRPTIALASRSTDAHVESTIGVVTHDISNNSDGYVTTMGLVRGIVTTGLTEGAPIYLDTTAGSFTETRPTSGHVLRVGWVVVAGNNGTVLVHAERLSTTNAFVNAAIADDTNATWFAMGNNVSGSFIPDAAPSRAGLTYIHTSGRKWFSVGTSSVDDWIEIPTTVGVTNDAAFQSEFRSALGAADSDLSNITATAKDNLEALGVLTDDNGPDNAAVAAAAAGMTQEQKALLIPEVVEVDYLTLADGATAVIPDGALARVGGRLYMGDGVLDGGRRIGQKPLFISAVKQLDSSTALKTGTGLSDKRFVEIGRIDMDPEDLAVGKILSMCGKVKFSATVAPSAQRRFTLIPASLWDLYVTDPEGAYAATIEAVVSTTSGAWGFIPGNGTTDNTVTEMDMDVAMSALMTLELGNLCYWVNRTKPVYGRGYNWLPTPGATTQVAGVGGAGSYNFDITTPDELVLVFSLAANIATVIDLDINLNFSIA